MSRSRNPTIVAAAFILLLSLAHLVSPSIAATPTAGNYQGLWWNAPAGSESGWGMNFAHQGDVIFATWYTYDASGKTLWLTMTANKAAEGTYAGTLYLTRGPAFNAVPFSPAAVTATQVGSGTLTFADASNGIFAYTVNGISQAKTITRQVFGPLATCTFGAQPDLALATNYQDIWWAAPAGVESGWGVNFTHQGDIIFATWFTYDVDGTPLWVSATTPKSGPGIYTGTVYRTTGPAFNAVPFLPANVALTQVGTLTLTFSDGNNATFAYTLNGVTQSKSITRQVFRTPGTLCQYAEGVWQGTTSDNKATRTVVLDDGTYYMFYKKSGSTADEAIVQGLGRADNGQFTSSNGVYYPIAQANESDDQTSVASLAGTYTPQSALQLTTTDLRGPRTLASTLVAGSGHAGDLASAAGFYTGISGHVGGRITATFSLDASGNIRGSNDACVFFGTAIPRKSLNVFDLKLESTSGCIFRNGPIYGVMYSDAAARKIYGAARFAMGEDLFYLIGTR